MSTITPDSDTASITSALIGTWRYPATEEPTGTGYIHLTADGRAFMFVYNPDQPDRRTPSRLWYSVESASTLRIRAKGSPDGWTCNYRFNGTTLTLLQPSRTFICTRATPSETPDWFRDALAARLQQP